MSFQITTAFVQNYQSTVSVLLQQKGSKLRDAVTVGQYTGKAARAVDQIGPVVAQKAIGRHADTPMISTPHDARWIYPQDYEWADMMDDLDKLRMIADPSSAYAQNGAYALGRAMDDEIIGAFFGTAKTGETGATSTAFPTSTTTNVVSVNTGGSASGLNVAKLRAAKKMLMAAQVDLDADPIFCAITAQQHDDLLNELQVVSLDYNTRPVLVDGKVTSFMGINFLHCERLVTGTDDASGTSRALPIWARSGMHLGIWEDIMARVDQRPDKRYSTQIFLRGTFGATRVEEGKVIKVWCR